ncbi:DUF87 domain-containing protein [Devosia sp.]|uniref:ATP-binding protein n=1 Tax=Devosia sp. TaxID=1871048 RepID=UPI001B1CA9F7|nr:DUF87 domain-containing protein [Devosia sp.]MBO9590196.1 ATP-binding protein [Devosia sp.]
MTIKERVIVLIGNALLAYAAYVIVGRQFQITGALQSAWLIAALSMWFLNLLSSPWFVPPRDALATGAAAAVLYWTIDVSQTQSFIGALEVLRWVAFGYVLLLIAVALVALFSLSNDSRSATGAAAARLSAAMGKGELIFTPAVLVSVIGGYQPDFGGISWLVALWVFFVIGRPIEKLFPIWKHFQLETKSMPLEAVGAVIRVDDPNIVRVSLSSTETWQANRLHLAAMADGSQHYVVALFSQVNGAEILGTGLCIAQPQVPFQIKPQTVISTHDEQLTKDFLSKHSGMNGATLVGFVVENSSIGLVRFEVASTSPLAQGGVVFLLMQGRIVFYQILDAETSEESFDRNPRGTHIVMASQIGAYDAALGFEKFSWLPSMNAPVFWAATPQLPAPTFTNREFALANVPETGVAVAAKIDDLINYHTAILGVTGTGKTELALDIVREAVSRDVKVFCVDFTGQYARRLADCSPSFPGPSGGETQEIEQKMRAVDYGAFKAEKERKALDEALDGLRESTEKQVADYLMSHGNLAIFELAEITNTRATLRITEMYLSAIMRWAKENRGKRQVLIVLEEAHTIIPETGGAGFDFDTQGVVNRIGQIALQGRKYGVGLLVLSQRTALVSKTILSQCNTFLTHTLIDQTSLSFLDSVYSSQHARMIPNLGRYEFLAYGKGVRSSRPIILRREFDQAKLDAS